MMIIKLKNYNIFTSNNQVIRNTELLQLKNLFQTERNFFYILNKMKQKKGIKISTTQRLRARIKKLSPGAQLLHKVFAGRVVYSIAPRREKAGIYKAIKFVKEAILPIKNKSFQEKIAVELLHPTSALSLKKSYEQLLAEARLNYRKKFSFFKRNKKKFNKITRFKKKIITSKQVKQVMKRKQRKSPRKLVMPLQIRTNFRAKKFLKRQLAKRARRIRKLIKRATDTQTRLTFNVRQYVKQVRSGKIIPPRNYSLKSYPEFIYPKISDNYFNNIENFNKFYKTLNIYNDRFIRFYFPGLHLPKSLSIEHKTAKNKRHLKILSRLRNNKKHQAEQRKKSLAFSFLSNPAINPKTKLKKYLSMLSSKEKKYQKKEYNKNKNFYKLAKPILPILPELPTWRRVILNPNINKNLNFFR